MYKSIDVPKPKGSSKQLVVVSGSGDRCPAALRIPLDEELRPTVFGQSRPDVEPLWGIHSFFYCSLFDRCGHESDSECESNIYVQWAFGAVFIRCVRVCKLCQLVDRRKGRHFVVEVPTIVYCTVRRQAGFQQQAGDGLGCSC